MNSFPVVDAEELSEADEIRWRLSLLRHFYDTYCRLEDKGPTARSQLAADDRATGWMPLSHQVKAYLNMAADNVRALLETLLVKDRLQVPLHAHYPVIRAALEGAAEAKWILLPDDHRERVRRSLSARFSEEAQDQKLYTVQRTAILLHNQLLISEMAEADRIEDGKHEATIAEIRRCSDAVQLNWGTVSSGAPGMEAILRRVADSGDVPGDYAASVWKVLSGLSHPSASRAVRHAHIEELSESVDGIISARVTASLSQTQQGLLVAQAVFMDAVLLYQRRLVAPHSNR